jgi:hypothetical protein
MSAFAESLLSSLGAKCRCTQSEVETLRLINDQVSQNILVFADFVSDLLQLTLTSLPGFQGKGVTRILNDVLTMQKMDVSICCNHLLTFAQFSHTLMFCCCAIRTTISRWKWLHFLRSASWRRCCGATRRCAKKRFVFSA